MLRRGGGGGRGGCKTKDNISIQSGIIYKTVQCTVYSVHSNEKYLFLKKTVRVISSDPPCKDDVGLNINYKISMLITFKINCFNCEFSTKSDFLLQINLNIYKLSELYTFEPS